MAEFSGIPEYPTIKYDESYLDQQLKNAEGILGIKLEPENTLRKDLLTASPHDLRKDYPVAFDVYQKAVQFIAKEERGSSTHVNEILNFRSRVLEENLDRYINQHESSAPGEPTLRPYQMDVFNSITSALKEGKQEGYIKLPTGTGKTVLFTEFLEASRMKTLLVVPSQILVNQAGKEVKKFATSLDMGKIYAESNTHGKHVTITTYDSLVNKVASGEIDPKQYGLLILDEAHRALSDKRQEAVRKFTHSIKLGFTATPKFNEEKQVSKLLEHEIYAKSIEEAANEGIIAPFIPYIVETSLDLSNVSVNDGEYNQTELERAVNIQGRNQAAVEVYKSRPELSGKTGVAYCVGVDHARALASEFNEQGISAAVISGETSEKVREEILRDYKEGKIKMLCNADLLIEGFNEKQASVCLNLRPTKSIVIAEQRAGRVLRLDEENPEKIAYVVDFLDEGSSEKNRPVLFTDIVNMTAIEPTSSSTQSHPDEHGDSGPAQIIDVDGLEVKINVSLDDVLHVSNKNNVSEKAQAEVSEEEVKEIEVETPWHTWEEFRDEYKLPEELKPLVEHTVAWRPKFQRESQNENGETVVEYTPQAIESACSKIVMNEIVENINSLSKQSDVIPIAVIKVFMEEVMGTNPHMVKDFMQYLSSDERNNLSDPIVLRDKLEASNFVKELRKFTTRFKGNLGGSRFEIASKQARELLRFAA